MSNIATRKAVVDFILACEALLSSSTRGFHRTDGECSAIARYMRELSQTDKQWSKSPA
jgi:hypothetical protein